MSDTANKAFSRILGNLDDKIKVLESRKKKKGKKIKKIKGSRKEE